MCSRGLKMANNCISRVAQNIKTDDNCENTKEGPLDFHSQVAGVLVKDGPRLHFLS